MTHSTTPNLCHASQSLTSLSAGALRLRGLRKFQGASRGTHVCDSMRKTLCLGSVRSLAILTAAVDTVAHAAGKRLTVSWTIIHGALLFYVDAVVFRIFFKDVAHCSRAPVTGESAHRVELRSCKCQLFAVHMREWGSGRTSKLQCDMHQHGHLRPARLWNGKVAHDILGNSCSSN